MPVKYKYRQISLKDTFSNCQDIFMDDAPSFFQLLNGHFDIQEFIVCMDENPTTFERGQGAIANGFWK